MTEDNEEVQTLLGVLFPQQLTLCLEEEEDDDA